MSSFNRANTVCLKMRNKLLIVLRTEQELIAYSIAPSDSQPDLLFSHIFKKS